ncbi:MAG TPA: DUF1501 domain-containing protein [Gemmatimonadaceae bacterium]|nr:DUF1501 domain-containing protein [Gemmatimonadaceae bacterium]
MGDNGRTNCGCREYNELSRRNFIIGSAGAAVFGAIMPAWLPKVVFARSANSSRDVIVNIFQRGGADGLSLVAPYTDANYYAARPTIAIPRPDSGKVHRGTALDGTFQFAEGMLGLLPAYRGGELLVLQGAGLSFSSRSHFDAQHFIEVGKADDLSLSSGWLGRHLATSDPMTPGATLRGVAVANGLPDTLAGAPKTLPIPDPGNFSIDGNGDTTNARTDWLATDYFRGTGLLRSTALDAAATIALLRSINVGGYMPSNGARYPDSSFGTSLRAAAALIKADIGVEAIQVDIDGWDTHTTADPLAGQLYNLMSDFADSVGAFWADVLQGSGRWNVTLVSMSEFGRNVRQNGDAGTDHGRGGVMFVMGHHVSGGRVLTRDWQPLATDNLEDDQDLKVTIDHRDVLAEIVKNRLGNPNLDVIFPDYTPSMLGVTK